METIKLPSGAELNLQSPPPFAISKSLFRAITKDILSKIDYDAQKDREVASFLKDIFVFGLVSDSVESAVWECMKYVTYNGKKIDSDTFEKEEARQDYIQVMYRVAEKNCAPFMKGLLLELSLQLAPNVAAQA